jgi:hypothetical protein
MNDQYTIYDEMNLDDLIELTEDLPERSQIYIWGEIGQLIYGDLKNFIFYKPRGHTLMLEKEIKQILINYIKSNEGIE